MWIVRHAMTQPVVSISLDATLDEALELMLRWHVSGLPVVDLTGTPVGVISEADLLSLYSGSGDGCILFETCEQHMTTELVAVQESADMCEAAQLLLENNVRRLLVLHGEKLVGVIARRDVVRCMRDDGLVISKSGAAVSS